jgi:hypothetical protein
MTAPIMYRVGSGYDTSAIRVAEVGVRRRPAVPRSLLWYVTCLWSPLGARAPAFSRS